MRSVLNLIFLFSAAGLVAASVSDDERALNDVGQVVGQLIEPEIDGYYGSALMYDADERRIYLLTNNHTVPELSARPQWRFKGALTAWQPRPVTLVGRSPGYDVAVLAIDRAGTELDPAKHPERGVQEHLRDAFFEGYDFTAPNVGKRVALIGAPRYFEAWNLLAVQGQTWKQEMRSRAATGETRVFAGDHAAFSEWMPLPEAHSCPPPFLDQCYLVQMRSWGYSGGALVTTGRDAKDRLVGSVVGMVSHYSPLADETYAIPFPRAKREAERLRARARAEGDGVVELEDENHRYRMLPDGRVEILKGALAGKIVGKVESAVAGGNSQPGGIPRGGGSSQPGGIPRGGGDSQPGGIPRGGGDSQPGGIPRGGGGFDPRLKRDFEEGRAFLILPEESGITNFLGSYPQLLASMKAPEHWGEPLDLFSGFAAATLPFKGTDSVFDYQAGVPVTDASGQTHTVYSLGPYAVVNLSNFLYTYRLDPSSSRLGTTPELKPIPRELSLRADTFGLHTSGSIRRWRNDEKDLLRKLNAKTESTSGWNQDELEVVLKNFASDQERPADEPNTDLLSHRESNARLTAITKAEFRSTADFQTLYLTDAKEGEVKIWFSGPLIAKGNYHYEARGKFFVAGRDTEADYGVLSLEWEFRFSRWEVKLLLAGKRNSLFVVRDPYFTNDELRLEAVFVPLVEPRQ